MVNRHIELYIYAGQIVYGLYRGRRGYKSNIVGDIRNKRSSDIYIYIIQEAETVI